MATKTVKILLAVTVRDLSKSEREEGGLSLEDCEGAAEAFGGEDLAELVGDHIVREQDEILAGSNSIVRIVSVDASPQ